MADEIFVGRTAERKQLAMLMEQASKNNGKTVLLSGQPGIGKTALVDAICKTAIEQKFNIIRGGASQDIAKPFYSFSQALEDYTEKPLFEEQEHVSFAQLFAINPSGLLIAKASQQEEELDADIFAGMLTAVQSFVSDSFDASGSKSAGLGRLEYGSMKILIEHSQHMFLVAVLKEKEHPDMAQTLKSFLRDIENEHGHLLDNWKGQISQVMPIEKSMIIKLQTKFLVRKDLEGVKIEAERVRIAENVLALIEQQTSASPVLLILEDIHWADENSIFVFRHLARNIGSSKILMMTTSRPLESKNLEPAFQEMKSDGQLVEIALDELRIDDAKELLDKLYSPNIIPGEFLKKLASQCRGNPFFMKELLAQMASEGALIMRNGSFVLERENYEVPKSVEEVLDRRLAALETDAMALVEFASCLGQHFPVHMVQGLQTVQDSDAALNKLQNAGIITRVNGSAEFSHALFQDVVYNNIADRWKTMHHLQIAMLYEQNYKEQLDQVIYELARHYARTREHHKAIEYSVRAAEKAESSFAVQQAMDLYHQALAALDKLGKGAEPAKRVEILERLADSMARAEKLDDSLETYMLAYELVSTKQDKSRLRRKRSVVFSNKAEFDLALEEAKLAQDEAEPGSAEHWHGLHQSSVVFSKKGMTQESLDAAFESHQHLEKMDIDPLILASIEHILGTGYWHQGDYDKALEYLYHSLEVREANGDRRSMSGSYHNISIVNCEMGKLDDAIEIQKKALEIDISIKNIRGIAGSLANLGVYYQRKGQFQEAYDWTKKSSDEFAKIGDKFGLSRSALNLGVMVMELGDIEKAYDYFLKSYEGLSAMGDKQGTGISVYFIGSTLWEMGDIEEAEKWLKKSLELNEEIGEIQRIIGSKQSLSVIMVRRGQHAEAETLQRECLEKSKEMKDMEGIISSLAALAHNLMEQKRWDESRDILNETLEKAIEHSMESYEATCHHILARLEADQGNLDAAIKEFKIASQKFQDINAMGEQSKVIFHWGKAIGDMSRVQKALENFEKMGMKDWARQAKEILK